MRAASIIHTLNYDVAVCMIKNASIFSFHCLQQAEYLEKSSTVIELKVSAQSRGTEKNVILPDVPYCCQYNLSTY